MHVHIPQARYEELSTPVNRDRRIRDIGFRTGDLRNRPTPYDHRPLGRDQRQSGQHLVLAPRELSQHARRVLIVSRLAEHLAADQHDGVSAQDEIRRVAREGGTRLLDREASNVITRRLEPQKRFVDVDRHRFETNPRSRQQFGPTW